jgi:4-amino-4-deoxy-L-arabinose transferase
MTPARSSRKWVLLGLLLWAAGLALTPLTESTEGRYASVGAAMARSGQWLEPTYSGLPHYTKPPWAYWAVAASLQWLPDQAWAARLPATAAALCAWLLALGLARSLGADATERSRLKWLLLSSPLFLVQARLPSGDIHLAAAVMAVYWSALGQDRSVVLRVVVGSLGFAVGILAKGHIIFLWTLLPMLVWWLRRPRERGRAMAVVAGSLVLGILLALPWFLWATHRHPGLWDYWMGSETADRVLTDTHSRGEPWWYFPLLLPLSILPWLPEALRAMVRAVRRDLTRSLLGLGVLLPLVVLEFSVSKRPNYLLPLVILLAVMSARVTPGRGWKQRCLGAAALWIVAPLLLAPVSRAWPVTRQLAAAVGDRTSTVLVYHELPSSLPFYLGRPVATLGVQREARFATPAQRDRYLADGWDLTARLGPGDVVLSPRNQHRWVAPALQGLDWRVRQNVGQWELIEVERRP